TGEKATPKRQAYMPLLDRKSSSWVISVSRTERLLDQNAIERNGMEVGKASNRVLLSYTRITAADIRSVPCLDRQRKKVGSMDVVADEPPAFHAHLVKYPELIEGENPKLLQMECAQELANRSSPVTWRTLPMEEWEKGIGTK
ncbi:MAG: hypothetical protein ABIY71_01800, partial [Flavobacteriales bacterium]